MENKFFQNQNNNNFNIKNHANSGNSEMRKPYKNIDNNISYSQSDEDKSEYISESHESQYNDNSFQEENIQNIENVMNNYQKYNNMNNYNKDLNTNNIYNKTLNNNINHNKTFSSEINKRGLRTYNSEKKLSGYSDFFLKDKRALSGEKNYKPHKFQKNYDSENDSDDDDEDEGDTLYNLTFNNLKRNANNYIKNNNAPNYSNVNLTKQNVEINNNIVRNVSQEFDSYKKYEFKTLDNNKTNINISPNLPSKNKNYISKVKKLSNNRIEERINNNNFSNISNNIKIGLIKNDKEIEKVNELQEKNNSIDYNALKNPFSSDKLNGGQYQGINNDSQPRLTKRIPIITNQYSINTTDINNERKTFVKKLPPLNDINNKNDDNNTNEEMDFNEKDKPRIAHFSNNLGMKEANNNTFINKPKITIKKLENRIIPIENNENKTNDLNNKKILSKKEINNFESSSSFNPKNNAVILLSQENEITNPSNNINRNFISQNKSQNLLINQNPQNQLQSNYIENDQVRLRIQGDKNQRMPFNRISIEENKNIYYSNNSNQFIQRNEIKEEEKNGENKNINIVSNKNNVNIKYNDFDGSGWVKNYGGVTRPGKDITGKQKIDQDSLVSLTNINNIKDFNIFGVLDGHGLHGHHVSLFASEYIPSQIINNPNIKTLSEPEKIYEKLLENDCQIIVDAFLECDEQLKYADFDSYDSGTTCVLVIHIGIHIICANSGDSRAIAVYDEQGDSELNFLKSAQLSTDYKPFIPEEKNRIIMSGGIVIQARNEFGYNIGPFRVFAKGENYPGLAMSRSIGDLRAKSIGIISDPGIIEYELNEYTKYIVIGSDGVWDYLSNDIIKEIGKKYYLENNASQFCHQIINNAVIQWQKNNVIIDDITAVVIFF